MWNEHGDDEDAFGPDQSLHWINNETYAHFLGFPESFAQFIAHCGDDDVVNERLNRSLPVSLWQHIFKPLQSLFQVTDLR